MAEKTQIINELGAEELLLPKMISEALVANDRVKYLFALVQNARASADNPSLEVSDLRSERLSAGVSDESLDRVAASSSRLQDGSYHVPQVGAIFDGAVSSIEAMMRPLQMADTERKAAATGTGRGSTRSRHPSESCRERPWARSSSPT